MKVQVNFSVGQSMLDQREHQHLQTEAIPLKCQLGGILGHCVT